MVYGSIWQWLLWLIVFAIPFRIAQKKSGRDVAIFAFLVNLIAVSLFRLTIPAPGGTEAAVAFLVVLAMDLLIHGNSPAWRVRILQFARKKAILASLAVLLVSVVPLGLLEIASRLLTDRGILKYHHGIQTVWRSGSDDWRMATITGDENREPDPVLLWQPAVHRPYNAQRMKGPLVEIPKPHDVFRVMCFGDSLTDGPPKSAWPARLNSLLEEDPPVAGKRVEVVNAGVAGYSSHQGLLRFLREVDRFQPDLLLVSFGWNDAAEAIGQPDKTFKIPARPVIALQRALIRYRAYLVMMYYSRGWRVQPEPELPRRGPLQPRVSIDEYVANLERFRAEAQSRGIPLVVLTRPHKLAPEQLAGDSNWRGSVPRYNAALRDWAARRRVTVIDVQRFFQDRPSALFSDECHLTTDGHDLMAHLIRDQVVPSGADKPVDRISTTGSKGERH